MGTKMLSKEMGGGGGVSEWETIDSAPENTWFISYADWDELPIGISRYKNKEKTEQIIESQSRNKKGRRFIVQEKTVTVREWDGTHFEPTHWMPLPKPPKDKE